VPIAADRITVATATPASFRCMIALRNSQAVTRSSEVGSAGALS
jgi:hypothetical protein